MKARDFCYWLQGYFEVAGSITNEPLSLTQGQVEMIKKHLEMVFVHDIDPSFGGDEEQKVLNEIHNSGIKKPLFKSGMRC